MSSARVVLTDVDVGVWHDEWSLTPGQGPQLSGSSDWFVQKRTLRGGLSDGVDVVDLCNGPLSVSILPTRGMGLWRGEFEGIPIEWRSPVARPVHPAFVNLMDRGGLGWLSGFNELLCRCGLAFHGPPGIDVVVDDEGNRSETPLTLHGRIANTPAHHVAVEVDPEGDGTLSVTGVVEESSMFGSRLRLASTLSTTAGSNRIRIEDRITNLAGGPAEIELLYHTNIGRPFLEPGSRIVCPVKEMAPRDPRAAEGVAEWDVCGEPQAGYTEQVYFFELATDEQNRTAVLLHNAAGNLGFSMEFDTRQLPCFTFWKNTQAEADGYVIGLEPSTSFPNLRSYERERGRVILLPPGGEHVAELEISIHNHPAQVEDVRRRIEEIGSARGELHGLPLARFSPVGS